MTDAQFRRHWHDGLLPIGQPTAARDDVREFEEPVEEAFFAGGRDGHGDGHAFCGYVQWEFMPAGISDLVVFFVRRIFGLLRQGGFSAFITTNSIKDGEIRGDGLDQVIAQGGEINMAVRAIKWPGRANLFVSLVAIHNGRWKGRHSLDGLDVALINTFLKTARRALNRRPYPTTLTK